jgi:uncharacterized protein (DUF1800 family)
MDVLAPITQQDWSYEKAAHLLSRAAFGGTPEEIEAAHRQGLVATLQRLLDQPADASIPPPAWTDPQAIVARRMEFRKARSEPGNDLKAHEEFRHTNEANISGLRDWWLKRMFGTATPLVEKMTLFWHSHFATSYAKVEAADQMWLQNDTLRRHALGNFVVLTKAISRDAAMMVYLDLHLSGKAHPNENWARELMELFTVGIGNYTEADIRESARAFTGYRVSIPSQGFHFDPAEHDGGPKTFMGRTEAWDGDGIINALSKQPACSKFMAQKLWRFFAEDEPAKETVDALAARIRLRNYEMRPVLREIFSSAEFYADAAMHTQIKSPVQFLVGTAKLLGTDLPEPPVAQKALRQMGQELFAPPNVKGWDGGKSWVSTSTLLFRYNFANYLINGDHMGAADGGNEPKPGPGGAPHPRREPIDVNKIIPAELRDKPDELVATLSRRAFGRPAPEKDHGAFVQFIKQRQPDTSDTAMRELLHLMTSTPQFQLA